MTAGATLPAATSTAPTARRVWTSTRGVLSGFVLLLAAAVAIAAVQSTARHGSLDPRSADPSGSRAVAELLAARGVSTRVVSTLDGARAAAGPDTTLLVAAPDLLTPRQQERLRAATAGSGGRTVLVAPSFPSVARLAPGVTADPVAVADPTLAPDCALAAARRAGDADTGGVRYHVASPRADTCYPSEGRPTLVRLPAAEHGDTVVVGSPDILRNKLLGERGNASLALQLLGSRTHLVWYLPSLSDSTATDDTGGSGFLGLIPGGWLWGTLQLFFAAVLAALWRARRFGPLVAEKLPVAIRASETAEGRARLYRKVGARDRASDALRAATRLRLARLLGLAASRAHTPEVLLPALAARLDGREQALHALLFGPPPRDDAALVSLADQLDALEREVRRP